MKLNFLIFEDENSLDETSLIKKKNLLDEAIVLYLSNYSKTKKDMAAQNILNIMKNKI